MWPFFYLMMAQNSTVQMARILLQFIVTVTVFFLLSIDLLISFCA